MAEVNTILNGNNNDTSKELKALTKKIKSIDTQIDNVVNAIANADNSNGISNVLSNKLTTLTTEKEQLEQSTRTLTNNKDSTIINNLTEAHIKAKLLELEQEIKTDDRASLKAIIKEYVSYVVVYTDSVEVKFNLPYIGDNTENLVDIPLVSGF